LAFTQTGQYSAKSAYEAMFIGAVQFNPWERIWKSWAPGKCKFFLWLTTRNKCWTADRLAKRGLAHPKHCPLCGQEEETIDHLLLSCVFSRQIWFYVLEKFSLQALAPQPDEHSFEEWWDQVSRRVPGQVSKGLNSNVISGGMVPPESQEPLCF
jgi:hypothetical protein